MGASWHDGAKAARKQIIRQVAPSLPRCTSQVAGGPMFFSSLRGGAYHIAELLRGFETNQALSSQTIRT